MKKLSSNILRIGEFHRVEHGMVQLIIPEDTYFFEIILLEQLIGDYKIISVDFNLLDLCNNDEDFEDDEEDENLELFYFVQTNIPWEEFYLIPDPDLKYLKSDSLN